MCINNVHIFSSYMNVCCILTHYMKHLEVLLKIYVYYYFFVVFFVSLAMFKKNDDLKKNSIAFFFFILPIPLILFDIYFSVICIWTWFGFQNQWQKLLASVRNYLATTHLLWNMKYNIKCCKAKLTINFLVVLYYLWIVYMMKTVCFLSIKYSKRIHFV